MIFFEVSGIRYQVSGFVALCGARLVRLNKGIVE